MADNTTLNPGTGGDVIATEDISGTKLQRVKLVIGNAGTDAGDVSSTNPIPATQAGTWYLQSINGTSQVNSPNASNFLATIQGTVTAIQSNASNFLATVSGTVSANCNISQIGGTTVATNSGTLTAGTQRVVIATDQPQLTNKLLVTPDANSSFSLGMVAGQAISSAATGIPRVGVVGSNGVNYVESVAGVRDTMPRKRDATAGLSPVYYVGRITSKTTTTVTAATAYASVIKVSTSNIGTAATLNILDIAGNPNRTLAAVNVPGGNMILGNYLESYAEPIKFTNGIQIITGGTTFGDCNVAITYWQ